jgi:hypothetical protein
MVIDAEIVAVKEPRQIVGSERMVVDRDGGIVGAMHPAEYLLELRIAVDEKGFHGHSAPIRLGFSNFGVYGGTWGLPAVF